jgi:uncharacterized membrane protein (DUF485 family)
MKKMFAELRNKVRKAVASIKMALISTCMTIVSTRKVLAGNRAEGYIDTAIKILIAVVLGALLLAGLYSLFGDTVLPTLVDRIKEMFNYAG